MEIQENITLMKTKMTSEELIIQTSNVVRDLLLEKNKAYGDSALNPANIFAKGTAIDNLCSRIDDKLMRIKNKGINEETEDTVQDLIGYLILLQVAIKNDRTKKQCNDIPEHPSDGRSALYNSANSSSTCQGGQELVYD